MYRELIEEVIDKMNLILKNKNKRVEMIEYSMPGDQSMISRTKVVIYYIDEKGRKDIAILQETETPIKLLEETLERLYKDVHYNLLAGGIVNLALDYNRRHSKERLV